LLGFSANIIGIQQQLCTVPFGQPVVSDVCGAMKVGDRPSSEERRAWETIDFHDCDAMRDHVRRFPDGALRDQATAFIASKRMERSAAPVVSDRRATGYVRQGERGLASVASARADALARARQDAGLLGCVPIGDETVVNITISPTAFRCIVRNDGHTCGLDYAATCTMKAWPLIERCGPP
jgi:hypothetical protein